MHQSVKNVPPTFQEVYLVLESIVIALENKIAIDLLKKPVEWGMVVN